MKSLTPSASSLDLLHCTSNDPHRQQRSTPLIGFFLPLAEAIGAGYLAVIATYTVLILLVTRLGRQALMNGDRVSSTYTLLLCATWLVASLAGAYLCSTLAPIPPYGPVMLPVLLALLSVAIVRRNVQQLPGQQSISATAGVILMIFAGTAGALALRHAF